jgi:hypothetical protein
MTKIYFCDSTKYFCVKLLPILVGPYSNIITYTFLFLFVNLYINMYWIIWCVTIWKKYVFVDFYVCMYVCMYFYAMYVCIYVCMK